MSAELAGSATAAALADASAGIGLAGLAELFGRFLMLSLLSIGGATTVAPEMHWLVVAERAGWTTPTSRHRSRWRRRAGPTSCLSR